MRRILAPRAAFVYLRTYLLRCRREPRFRKPFVKIQRQNVVSVRFHVELGVRLARRRGNHVQQLVLLERMDPIDIQRRHARLLAFLNHKTNHQIAFFSLVVVQRLPVHRRLQKSVCQVQIPHRIAVVLQEPSAESSPCRESLRVNRQAAAQQIGIEVMIPRDLDSQQSVPVAPLHPIGDDLFASLAPPGAGHLIGARRVLHFRVEISLALQSLLNIPLALFQQVRVDRSLLIHRHQLLQLTGGNFRPRHRNPDQRPFGHLQLHRNRVALRVVSSSPRHRSRIQVSPFHQKAAHTRSAALHTRRCKLPARL